MKRIALAAAAALLVFNASAQDGKATYEGGCVACHGTGVLGAPKAGDTAAWKARLAAAGSMAGLVASAKAGKGAMPPKGAMPAITDAQLAGAVAYMVGQAGTATAQAAKPAPAAAPAPAAVAAAKPAAPAPAPAAPAPVAAAPVAAPAPAPVAAVQVAAPQGVNSFNRLLRPPSQRNRPPAEDGIHDPGNDGTHALQPPLAAFNDLSRSNAGNRVDWVKSLRENRITPRADKVNAATQPMVMDLNIVREVKGSMPDVVYPHKQHTEWLDCSNCHPAIFKPQKGANQISMASILLGEACGTCHGKVAFPVSECRLCHSKPKQAAPATAAAEGTAAKQ
ncbi:c(7)-type cytochrome triheme domain-containing protein [Ramlibacter albus]|uniref:C-type cytochrome n=1 Tax=Ramlibacter albus TaxID=2079448 RepID=A0A923M7K8_9BURK|nr:c(7)-type cytochrome triheme domain-containing protein [Ramlibacter albus]MBC5764027.1 c-type cytochrome [Ramlibacter albus]